MLTTEQARDAMMGLVKSTIDAWNIANPSTPVAETVWDDAEAKSAHDGKVAWVRASVRHAESNQRSLGSVGRRRFTRTGVVVLQVYTPFGDGFTLADRLAMKALRDALEGSTTTGVWFRRVSAREVGKSGLHQQTNVVASFEYDERR